MARSQVFLNWNNFHDAMQKGFCRSQQNGDFVDLTLVADGRSVKVHKLILGTASPYIRTIVRSSPCEHPVIFFNEVSYTALCNILEYVYTGEVSISHNDLDEFVSVAKTLYIQGLDDIDTNIEKNVEIGMETDRENLELSSVNQFNSESSKKRDSVELTVLNDDSISSLSKPSYLENEIKSIPLSALTVEKSEKEVSEIEESNVLNESLVIEKTQKFGLVPTSNSSLNSISKSQELQYTLSSRGSLQLILNRYMYNLNWKSNKSQFRRWRCVDYRNYKCPACCVTKGNVVVRRTNMHIHPFHDKRILAKIEKKAIYSAVKLDNK